MRKDEFTLAYSLLVLNPAVYTLKIDGSIAEERTVSTRGLQELEFPVCFDLGQEKSIALHVAALPGKAMATINNMSIQWKQDINQSRTARMIKDRAPNEIWDYTDSHATEQALSRSALPRNQTITLDYMLDYQTAGYINRYCRFIGDDGEIDSLENNRSRPYIIRRSGQFVFTFRTPIAYWLLENFYPESAIS